MSNFTEVGTVIGYRRSGYGWLDWNGKRVWVHIRDTHDNQGHLLPALKVGWKIRFELTETPQGFRAMNARVVAVDEERPEETHHEYPSR